jgi:hypothetical protein
MHRPLQLLALALVARTAPAAIIFYEGWPTANGQWETASNWTPVRVPSLSTDDVVINYGSFPTQTGNPANVNFTVSKTINSLYVGAPEVLTLTSGTLTVSTTADILGRLRLVGGTIAGTAPLSLGGLRVEGAVTLGGTAPMTMNGDVEIANPVAISPFVWTRPISASNNVGVNWSQGNVSFTNNTLTVATNKIFRAEAGSSWAGGTLVVRGPIIKETTGFTALYPSVLTSSGGIYSPNGPLNLGPTTGNYTGSIEGNVFFSAGTQNFNEGANLSLANITTNQAVMHFKSQSRVNLNNLTLPFTSQALVYPGAIGDFGNVTVGDATNLAVFGGPGSPTIQGTTTLISGTLGSTGGTVNLKGNFNVVANSSGKDIRGAINSFANTAIADGGSLNGGTTTELATFNNSGTLNAGASGSIANTLINNAGLLRKASGAGEFLIYRPNNFGALFNNQGTVQVDAGTLRLFTAGSHSGTWINNGGSSTVLDGPQTFLAGTNVTNARFNNRGTMAFPSGSSFDGVVIDMNGGTLDVSAGSTGTLEALNYNSGSIVGTGDLTLSTPFTFVGGTFTGTGRMNLPAGATFTPSVGLNLGKPLTLGSTSTFSTGNLTTASAVEIPVGATMLMNSPNGTWTDGSWTINGTLKKTTGGSTTTITSNTLTNSTFNNQGVVRAEAGTLAINLKATHSGEVSQSGSGVLDLRGIQDFVSGGKLGPGSIVFTQGNINMRSGSQFQGMNLTLGTTGSLPGVMTVDTGVAGGLGSLTLAGGVLQGAGDVAVSGPLFLNFGFVVRSGRLLANGGLQSTSSFSRTLNCPLEVGGTSNLGGGTIDLDDGTMLIKPGAEVNLSGDASIFDGITTNNGTIRKNGGAPSYIGRTNNSVTLFDNQGTILVSSGDLGVDNLLNLKFATGKFEGGTYGAYGGRMYIKTVAPIEFFTKNAASLAIFGPTSQIHITSGLLGTFVPIIPLIQENLGDISIGSTSQSGSQVMINRGTIGVLGGGDLTLAGINQFSGFTQVQGTLNAPFTMQGGGLSGGGTLVGTTTLTSGFFSPGPAIGPMYFTGNLSLGSGVLSEFEAEEPGFGGHDVVNVSGTASLNGKLVIDPRGMLPTPEGTKFKVINAANISGQFSNVQSPGLYRVMYTPSFVEVEILRNIGDPRRATGRVELQDFVGAIDLQKVTVSLWDDGELVVEYPDVALDKDGRFSLFNTVPGTFTVRVRGRHWMTESPGRYDMSGEVDLSPVSLINGDVDGDNIVSIVDYIALSAAYETTESSVNWNPDADLDGDGEVSILDYIILSTNYDREGS